MKRRARTSQTDVRSAVARGQPDDAGPPACASVVVCAGTADEITRRRAAELAAQFGLPLDDASANDELTESAGADQLRLVVTPERLELRCGARGGPGPLYVDFVRGPMGYARRRNRFGLLFQAVGFRTGRPTVLDATAGLGRDAFRLAYHGCRVLAFERSPVLAALLADGLERALRDAEIGEHLQDRLQVRQADARDYLRALAPADAPDVVYLDPMFPPKKKGALVKVEMRILRQLVGDDPDAAELCDLARAVARQRVVVKRHRLAPPLAAQPTASLCDKTTRYDVYVRPAAPGGSSSISPRLPACPDRM